MAAVIEWIFRKFVIFSAKKKTRKKNRVTDITTIMSCDRQRVRRGGNRVCVLSLP